MVGAVLVLVAMAIPFLLITIAIKATSSGPVFFRQVRVGRGERLFRIYKFRTMVENASPQMTEVGLDASASVTPVGRFLRITKFDELPQLINVLAGDMNLVGPRPELPEFVAEYSARDRCIVLSVEPGLSDFASIRFRNEGLLLASQENPLAYYHRVVMRAKLRYCRFYVSRASLALDLYLIALTIRALGQDFLARLLALWSKTAPLADMLSARFHGPIGRFRHRPGAGRG